MLDPAEPFTTDLTIFIKDLDGVTLFQHIYPLLKCFYGFNQQTHDVTIGYALNLFTCSASYDDFGENLLHLLRDDTGFARSALY